MEPALQSPRPEVYGVIEPTLQPPKPAVYGAMVPTLQSPKHAVYGAMETPPMKKLSGYVKYSTYRFIGF